MSERLVAIAGIDAQAAHGPWDEPVVLAPESLVGELQADGAKVVLLPSAPEPRWEPLYDRFDEIVLQDDGEFASWLKREAAKRGIRTWHTESSHTDR